MSLTYACSEEEILLDVAANKINCCSENCSGSGLFLFFASLFFGCLFFACYRCGGSFL